MPGCRDSVQVLKQVQLLPSFCNPHITSRCPKGQRGGRIQPHRDSRMLRSQIAAIMGPGSAAAVSRRWPHHNEAGQIVVRTSQPIVHPGTDGRIETVEDMPPGVKLKLRRMIVVGGPHGPNDGQIVDTLTEMRPPVTHRDATLSALSPADLHRIQLSHQSARFTGKITDVLSVIR